MALAASGSLSIKTTAGTGRSISEEVDGNVTGSKSLSTLSVTAGKTAPHSMLEFYGFTLTAAPGVPQNVEAVDGGSGQPIDVTWSPPISGGTHDYYVVERNEDTAGWVFFEQTTATASQDTTCIAASSYVYRVLAHNGSGDSANVETDPIIKA